MKEIIISEMPANTIGNLNEHFHKKIDRTGVTVREYLKKRNVTWIYGDEKSSDVRLYKEEHNNSEGPFFISLLSVRRWKYGLQKGLSRKPYISIIGEPRELSIIPYLLANPKFTFAVAPGSKFKRIYFPGEWVNPEIESWEKRLDKVCWIARPLPERISAAKNMINSGIDLDIFSKTPWPLENWKGYAEDELKTAKQYKYRVVFENSINNLYHSEKLFNSIRSGCVTFYYADPNLKLPHLYQAYLPYDIQLLQKKDELSQKTLNGIEKVMFTDLWEVYSFKHFFNTIIDFSRELLR